MKTRAVYIIGIIISCLLFSCGCDSKDSTTSKELIEDEVYGDGADLISIVSNKYSLEKKGDELRLKITLQLEKPSDLEISSYPRVILKDEDDVEVIQGWYQMEMSSSTQSKFDKFLQGEPGDTQEFVFINEFSKSYFEDALTKSESFSLDGLSFREDHSTDDIDYDLDEINDVIEQTQDIFDATEDIIETNQALLEMAKELSE